MARYCHYNYYICILLCQAEVLAKSLSAKQACGCIVQEEYRAQTKKVLFENILICNVQPHFSPFICFREVSIVTWKNMLVAQH